jgi:hypothetical protein
MNHTPAPWEDKKDGRIVGPSKDGLTVQTIAKVQGYADEVKADAAHIVKCVNLHEELVNILGQVQEFFKEGMAVHPGALTNKPDGVTFEKAIAELLAKAKGE